MADTVANLQMNADLVPRKKRGKNRKPLNPKNQSTNEANILAGKLSSPPGKENQEAIFLSSKKNNSFEKELQEVQEKLEQMRLEKEKTEELLKNRDEMLKQKDEELELKRKEQEKLQMEVKKLKNLKGFIPTVSFPLVQREKEEDKKGKKKKKKGEKVKKPCAAYILWCRDQWNEVKKENPNAEFKEISNILGAKWKNLSDDEKKPYEEKYQEDKEAYLQIVGKEKREKEAMKLLEEEQKQKTANELLEQYLQFKQEADEEIQKNGKKKTKKEKDQSKPKHSLSAFFLYMKDRRPELVEEKKNVSEIAKITGEEWKNMTEDQRRPYEEIAKNKREEYLKQMEIYKQKKEDEAETRRQEEEELMKIHKQEALQLLKKKEKADDIIKKTKEKRQQKKKLKEDDPNKPKRPPSSFLLFRQETRKNLKQEKPDTNYSTLNSLVTIKWKELSEGEKDVWNTKAANAMNAYRKEIQEYTNGATTLVAENEHHVTDNTINKESEEKGKKRRKEKSDPNKPKRPPSSFLLFSQEMRKALQQEKPEANNATLIAMITVKWKELSEAEKNVWNIKASSAMDVYKKEMEEYKNQRSNVQTLME